MTLNPSQNAPIAIIPRGLRSFDAADADFFLTLLPGTRDREGLPGSVRFWKSAFEHIDAEETFSVGLIYGPSGCGKSSLVKAGVIPLLASHIVPIYIEAAADRTESRLAAMLRKHFPDLPREVGLAAALARLRRGRLLPTSQKVVIILDQFEQWLHARRDSPEGELVEALRQCDGGRIQCLVMVRDDFWMAATRFMSELEVPLVEGYNSGAVDLFPIRHAEKVLAAFGRAFGALPELPAPPARDQRLFLEQAVTGLAQESKVICVRLALFAQMMKDRPWTPASLRGVGGASGVGATFLEETFSVPGAPPEHRYHQEPARAILKALLPSGGTDIKGHMQSHAKLLAVSGYASRPRDFDEVLHILDGELRLITPSDAEGPHVGGPASTAGHTAGDKAGSRVPDDGLVEVVPSTARYYQLTHDYLVPSLRDWLNRKMRETRRGRAELRLAEHTALWSAQPESRFLPAWWEWMALRLCTRKAQWSAPQNVLMRRAARYHAGRGCVWFAGLVLLVAAGREGFGRQRAQLMRHRLLEAATEDVPKIVREMSPYRRWIDEPLREDYAGALARGETRRQLHASLGLLPVDRGQAVYLRDRLLTASSQEVPVIRDALWADVAETGPRMWGIVENSKRLPAERLRAACALAAFAPDDPRWQRVGPDVAARLVAEPGLEIGCWAEALRPVRQHLLPPLAALLVGDVYDSATRRTITDLFGAYATGRPEAFIQLEEEAAGASKLESNPAAGMLPHQRRANAAVGLASLGRWQHARALLRHAPDPTVRSYIIDRLGSSGTDAKAVAQLGTTDEDVSVRRAALLALGEFDEDHLPTAERIRLTASYVDLYRDDPDPGIHAAAGWLLENWGQHDRLATIDRALVASDKRGRRRWHVNGQGLTMVLIPRGHFARGPGEGRTRYSIDHEFAIAAKEVTVADFHSFRASYARSAMFARTDDCPAHGVSWYDAAAYCNWLSDQEGIPEDQWCYLPNEEGRYESGMKVVPDFLTRTGYRLPLADEWEYACRAGSVTRWPLGDGEAQLSGYKSNRLNWLENGGSGSCGSCSLNA